jgi:hypothetical protein
MRKTLFEMDQEEFTQTYKQLKREGLSDAEIADRLLTNHVTLNAYKQVWKVETIKIRKNSRGVTEEHFRKGALIGLDRRIILRRVGDGMPISLAISTPRANKMVRQRRKRK